MSQERCDIRSYSYSGGRAVLELDTGLERWPLRVGARPTEGVEVLAGSSHSAEGVGEGIAAQGYAAFRNRVALVISMVWVR